MKRKALRLWLPSMLAVALLALNCGAALVYTIPESLRGRRMSARLAEGRQRIAESERFLRSSRERAATLDENAKDAARFYRRVLGDHGSAVVDTQQRLWMMAEESGLAPKTLTFVQDDIKAAPLTRLRVTMPLSGSYDQLLSFLGRVEQAEQFLIVDGIRLSSKLDRNRDLGIEISAYFHTVGLEERSRMKGAVRRQGRRP
ncbi:MAG: hypothetical protein JXO72_11670 [Vicinamibacteria bacterium]|nr:hypothetical protein [Vicinamibacteria bacterium]